MSIWLWVELDFQHHSVDWRVLHNKLLEFYITNYYICLSNRTLTAMVSWQYLKMISIFINEKPCQHRRTDNKCCDWKSSVTPPQYKIFTPCWWSMPFNQEIKESSSTVLILRTWKIYTLNVFVFFNKHIYEYLWKSTPH